ncbi:unnamed protein product [Rotaria sp. Silwood1]|nr:unnamed protein product [Rotaria sp. Silwood1]CAF1279722.1 unnamed protein product [Rotaria sp. Silwood1]CAF3477557.1 unnamed protein product [Rotaria sp. Silwood1]CAF3524055.1 unnamed protein product [Rotaria sp. Silwood1]CAF3547488.1 unnamed protein product [Rotaria sp. Silwood1]
MLSSFSRFITYPRLSLSLVKQQHLFASSKADSTSPKTGDTHQFGKKDIYKPTIDASHQSGTKSKQERVAWEKKEQGVSPDIQTRQERKTADQKQDIKAKKSKK